MISKKFLTSLNESILNLNPVKDDFFDSIHSVLTMIDEISNLTDDQIYKIDILYRPLCKDIGRAVYYSSISHHELGAVAERWKKLSSRVTEIVKRPMSKGHKSLQLFS